MKLRRSLDASELRHGDVCDDNVRMQLSNLGNQVSAIIGRPGNVETSLKQPHSLAQGLGVVVDNKYARTWHVMAPLALRAASPLLG